MKWNTTLLHAIGIVFTILFYLAHNAESHIGVASSNPKRLHSIYTFKHAMTNLSYHLDTGIVYKQDKKGLQSVYTHAHIICSEFPPQGTVLGYINKTEDCGTPQRYYVYIEPSKVKKMPE